MPYQFTRDAMLVRGCGGAFRSESVMGVASLILQRNDGLSFATESSHFLQVAIALGQGHHRAIAVNRVAIGGEVPATAFGRLLHMPGWLAHGW
jgi:hypothetical protein